MDQYTINGRSRRSGEELSRCDGPDIWWRLRVCSDIGIGKARAAGAARPEADPTGAGAGAVSDELAGGLLSESGGVRVWMTRAPSDLALGRKIKDSQ